MAQWNKYEADGGAQAGAARARGQAEEHHRRFPFATSACRARPSS